MAHSSNHTRANKAWFLGFGLYWTWVYLSFNSATVVSFSNGDETAITWLHIISGLAGCATFAVAIFNHDRLERAGRSINVLWAAAMVSAFGSMFYATEVIESAAASLMLALFYRGFRLPCSHSAGVSCSARSTPARLLGSPLDRSCFRVCSMV